MRPRLLALLRTTTFRLALVQAGIVLAFVLALLFYVYVATAGQLIADSDDLADEEFAALESAYNDGGVSQLNQEVVERAARDGPMLYALAAADGSILAGDFQRLPTIPAGEAERVDFNFELTNARGQLLRGRARGRIGRLLGQPILLVARDLGDTAVIVGRITQVLWTVAVLGFVVAAISGLLASWQAARRAEQLSNTAREVMSGDLTRRAPVTGVGDEFDALALAMNDMLDRLEKLMHTTRTAGDAIAHDLRSPLTRFRAKLEAALDAAPDSEADRAALRKALQEADRLLDMFQAVLKLSRVETASNWRFERVDITAIMQELVEFYQPAAEEIGLSFAGHVGDDLFVRGDGPLVTQAVSNLIENALKYTPAGGRVEVRATRRPDARVELSVLDDGPGVPAGERERVLERFVRLETARTTPGVGLGLSLVSAVARLHRGGLHLRDGMGQGGAGLGAALVLPAYDVGRGA